MTKHAPVSFALVRNTARYYIAQRRWRALARALWLTVVRRCGMEHEVLDGEWFNVTFVRGVPS